MSDINTLSTMFSNVDLEIVQEILDSNGGDLDRSISQLLVLGGGSVEPDEGGGFGDDSMGEEEALALAMYRQA